MEDGLRGCTDLAYQLFGAEATSLCLTPRCTMAVHPYRSTHTGSEIVGGREYSLVMNKDDGQSPIWVLEGGLCGFSDSHVCGRGLAVRVSSYTYKPVVAVPLGL